MKFRSKQQGRNAHLTENMKINLFSKRNIKKPGRRFLSQKGFTLIELLIVIVIIGILSGLSMAVIKPNSMKANGRDAQRQSDLRLIQNALEMYFADHRAYPCSKSPCPTTPQPSGWIKLSGSDIVSTALTSGGYISAMKLDPINSSAQSNPCLEATGYRYDYWSDGATYYLTAILEDGNNSVVNFCLSGTGNTGIPSALGYSSSCASKAVCVFVRNP